MIDLKASYKRIFAFGCSYTSHTWPTWANIIASQYPNAVFYNMGKTGSGNSFLLSRLSQTHSKFKIDKDDLVLIMYPSYTREDRYTPNSWLTLGNIYNLAIEKNHPIASKFFTMYGSYLHYLIRDISIIFMVENFLSTQSCDKVTLISTRFFNPNDKLLLVEDSQIPNFNMLIENFSELISKYPEAYEIHLKENFANKGIPTGVHYKNYFDYHPTPLQALSYLKFVGLNLKQEAVDYAHRINDKLLSLNSLEEILTIWGPNQTAQDHLISANGIT